MTITNITYLVLWSSPTVMKMCNKSSI